MLAAKRRWADCLHIITRTKTTRSSLQKTTTPSGRSRSRIKTNGQFITFVFHTLARVQQSLGHSEFPEFAKKLKKTLQSWDRKRELPLLTTLREAHYTRGGNNGRDGLQMQIQYLFYGDLANRSHSKSDIADQKMLADLRFPIDWYPVARSLQRSIHLHVGPTNSGKTYQALKRLEKAEHGIYAGPLRLLAHEVFMRLNNKGIPCHLITGDQKLFEKGAGLVSCTVETVPLNHPVEVAVIDEIQMIGDKSRGWAWTQALLGLRAKELHLCGEARTVPLIRELTTLMGDKLEVHHYERLSPLETMNESLGGKMTKLRKGDCIVAFSRRGVNEMKVDIERRTKRRVAIIYGTLPPEIRAQQARLFNDPNNDYDFLVASDAIGMGLNLNISRMVFQSSSVKIGGFFREVLSDDRIKQIGGRAGRYRVPLQTENEGVSQEMQDDAAPKPAGLVTSLHDLDFAKIIRGMHSKPTPVMTAGILPPSDIVSQFAAYFPPDTPFAYLLLRIHELARIHPRFHACDLKAQSIVADIIEPVRNLTIRDRYTFTSAPVPKAGEARDVCRAFAQCIANNGGGGLLEIQELDLTILDMKDDKSLEYQDKLETLHQTLTLYLWLGYRFDGIFHSRPLALYVQGLVQERIIECLAQQGVQDKPKSQKVRAGHISNGEPSNGGDGGDGGDGGPNKRRDSVLPPEAGVARPSQQLVHNIVGLNYLRDTFSEIRPHDATA